MQISGVKNVFQGRSALTLDAKGRVSVPTRHRDALVSQAEGRVTLTRHPDGCLLMYPRSEWEKKRAEIEALLERDPTIVVREERVRSAYEKLLTRSSEAEQLVFDRYNGRKRSSALNPLYQKALKAEVYDKTKIDVNQLHRLLFGGN